MSYGYDEFESKLGQFIYTMVMYERLREYLFEKLKGKDRVSVRINLGNDKSGNQVIMDVILTTVKPQFFTQAVEAKKGKSSKTFVMVLSNDSVSGENQQIASELERLILESLKWWHGYFGERDKLKLDSWRCVTARVFDADFMAHVMEIPVERIIIPQNFVLHVDEEEASLLEKYVDVLGPVAVRPLESGMYELVGSSKLFNVLVNRLGNDRVKAIVLDLDDERASSVRAEIEDAVEKLVKSFLNK